MFDFLPNFVILKKTVKYDINRDDVIEGTAPDLIEKVSDSNKNDN